MDYDLWLRAAQKTSPILLPVVLACFRQHAGSTSCSGSLNLVNEVYKVRNRYLVHPFERYKSYRTWQKRKKV